MKRLLCLTTGMNTGGAETFLMKVYRQLDRAKYQMDFCVTIPDNYYADEIRTLGGKLYMVPRKSKNPVANFLGVRKIVRENQYDYVIRVCENSLATLDLLAAKAGGAKHLAMRSSNANSASKIVRVLHKMFFFLPRVIPNIKIAPSRLAAEYTFFLAIPVMFGASLLKLVKFGLAFTGTQVAVLLLGMAVAFAV